jgi:hypothetical protein
MSAIAESGPDRILLLATSTGGIEPRGRNARGQPRLDRGQGNTAYRQLLEFPTDSEVF